MTRKEELQNFVDFQGKLQFVSRYQGWKIIEAYIRARIEEAEKAWHATSIDNLTNEKIVRKLMAQRAKVKALQDILNFVHSKEALETAMREINIIEYMEKEYSEE